jgi:hypothetical protein
MLASELEGILNAHAFLRVERPPMLWDPEPEAAGPMPPGDFVAVTIRSAGDWSPQTTWDPAVRHDGSLVGHDLETALAAASAAWAYTRELDADAGSVTALYPRRTAKRSGR